MHVWVMSCAYARPGVGVCCVIRAARRTLGPLSCPSRCFFERESKGRIGTRPALVSEWAFGAGRGEMRTREVHQGVPETEAG